MTHTTNRKITSEAPYSRTTKIYIFLGKPSENGSRFALAHLTIMGMIKPCVVIPIASL